MKQTSKLFLALMGATLLSANALAETQAPSLVAYDVNGDGTIAEGEKAYELKSADDLYWFANYVNDKANAEYKDEDYQSSANAVLTANITVNENLLSRLVKDNDGNVTNGDDFKAWNPIGFYYNYDWNVYYAGTFDGNGYTISGLYFNNGNQGYVGLIGLTTEGAVIKNVGVADSYFKGNSYVGGVCGDNYYGTIEKCYNTGKVEGSNNIGGVCGYNGSTIENCYNTGKVEGSNYIGGVCGYNEGTIENCYNTGDVSGGSKVGGVCGINYGTITKCYYLDSSADKGIGNDIGAGEATAQTADQFADGTVAQALREGTNGNVWGQYIGVDKSPKLTGVFCPKQITEGEYAGYYAISNADELYWFSGLVNGKLIGVEQNNSANAVLTADITINKNLLESLAFDENGNVTNGDDFGEWSLIGYYNSEGDYVDYAGTFDGKDHTISGLYFNNSSAMCVGLFGSIGSIYGATIKNVGVIDSYFKGSYYIGGVCGYNYGNGTIENCYNSGEVSGGADSYYFGGVCGYNVDGTIENCYNSGEVSGGDDSEYIGGVCGYNYEGTIENCYNTDEVSGGNYIGGVCGDNYYGTIENCYNIGEVSGGDDSEYIGGVCGINLGTIKNCYNTDEVSGGVNSEYIGGVCGNNKGTITNCYNSGEVSGGADSYYFGGVCGWNVDGTIENCYDFKLNSGTLSEYSIVVENNAIALPTEDMVSREGYQFGGWCTDEACEGEGITSEAEFEFDVHTLYAKWTEGSTPTAIKAVEAESNKTIKTIKDGQIVIIRNGVMYDMQGRKL